MQCKGKLRVVAKVENPDAVAAMLRNLGLDRDPNPDPKTMANECGPQLVLASGSPHPSVVRARP